MPADPLGSTARLPGRLAVLIAAVALAWTPTPTLAGRCPSRAKPATRPVLRSPEHASVLLLGDSNIFGTLGQALARHLRGRGMAVQRFGKPTSGLARPDFFDWPREAARLVASADPDVVVFMVGGNDHQRLESTASSGMRVAWRELDAWREEYGRRVREVAVLLRGEGRRVFFLSPTNRAPRIDREGVWRVARAQRDALEGVAGVTWIDMFALTTDAQGRWLSRGLDADGCYRVYRRPDGIHLTEEGGELVARRLLTVLDEAGLAECAGGPGRPSGAP